MLDKKRRSSDVIKSKKLLGNLTMSNQMVLGTQNSGEEHPILESVPVRLS